MAHDLSEQQSFILFNNEANFALLDTDPGASNGNGLYEQLVYIHDGYGTGWNEFHPIFLRNGNHNDWAAGGVGSDTLVGDSAGDLSTQNTGVDTIDGYRPSNDVLYGGDGYYLDIDNDVQSVILAREPLPTDDGPDDSTCPAFDNFDFGGFDINEFDLSNFHDFGITPRYDYAGDWLVGGRDNDTLFGQFGHDTLEGGEGRDWMFGGRDNDLMDGHYLDESPWAQTMSDAGDVMFGGRGRDTMYGGDDNVYNPWTYNSWQSFTGSAGQLCYGYMPLWDYDGDWMKGGGGRDTMYGENGFDTMYGDACIDKMYGGEHYDLMYGGAGSDIMAGGDYLDTADNGTGGEVWGQDYVNPNGHCEDRCAYEGNFDAQGLWPRGGDTMYGGRGSDVMSGGAGDDLMFGGYAHDLMYGNADDDRMLGENGRDTMYGGDGWDDMSGGNQDDSMFGGNGEDYMAGDNGNDWMSGGNHDDVMRGGNGADTMYGDDGDDIMYGNAGTDLMFGGEGNDCMHGGTERDTMYGDNGDDKIDGGEGADVMYGGAGDDIIWIGGGTANLYEEAYGDAGMDTFVYNFSFDEANNAANGDSGWVYIGDFTQDEDVLQLCFDDPVTFCCDDVDHTDPTDGVTAANWDYYNDNLLRALSVPDTDGQHAVKVVDNGDYTLIMFDSTLYAHGQDAKDPEAEDASDPQVFTDALIWLDGVSGHDVIGRAFANLEEMHEAGFRIEISHPAYYDYAKTVSGDQYGEGEWTYASCQIDCGCDIDPFALPVCLDEPEENGETIIA